MKNHKLAFVDLETTGLDPYRHEIIEIGIVFATTCTDQFGKKDLECVSEHVIQLEPEHIETADPEGLKVNKYYSRDWRAAVPQKEGLMEAAKLLEGTIFVAQNVTLDWCFMMAAENEYGISFDKILHYHKLDLASMAFGKLYHDPALFRFSLREMTEYFGVKNEDAHTALSDARATFEVCKELLAL